MAGTYRVGGREFDSFSEAVKHAQSERAEVYEIATGRRRWAPAEPSKRRATRHVIVNADGSRTPFSKVRRNA